jgi:glycosyltransferase involved in cell wall biosynthesis
LKIVVITQKSPFPPTDGGSVAFYNGLKLLKSLGHDIVLISFDTPKNQINWPQEFINEFNAIAFTVNTSHSFLRFLNSLFSPLSYILYRFFNSKTLAQLQSVIDKQDIEVVLFESIYTGVYARWLNAPVKLLKAHNIEHQIWNDLIYNESSYIKKVAFKLATRKLKQNEESIASEVNTVITYTTEDAVFFSELPVKTKVIPLNSPFADNPKMKNYTNHVSFFHLAAMDWLPNIEGLEWLISKVWPVFTNKNKDTHLYIAGKNMPEKFKQLPDLSIIYNVVNNAEDFMLSKGVMLVPLFSGSGIRVKIVEGMSLGLCIICTSKAAKGIPVSHKTNILIADTPEEFAELMLECVKNPSLVSQIGRSAKEFAKEYFSLNAIAEKWNEVLNEYHR